MTIEEKEEEMNNKVLAKLEENNIKITSIMSYFAKDALMQDGTKKDVIITSFTEALLLKPMSVYSDPETLQMLYARTGPTNFVPIETFFEPLPPDYYDND